MPSQESTATTDRDGESARRREQYLEFAAMVSLALGLGALGFGTGLHVSLMSVQGAVFDFGAVPLSVQAGDGLYQVLLKMQTWANRSLYASAVLLVGGGFLAERRRLRERISELAARFEDVDEPDGGDPDA